MTMTLAERPQAPAALQPAPGGSLAIHPEQTAWTADQVAVLRQAGIKQQVTSAELSGFLHLCQRTGLDPFSRQIYLIGRYSKKDGRDVYTPQTGIDGYRVIAQRVTAQTGGTYGYEDIVWCDPSGRWRDVWLAEVPPAAAKVTVIRNGQRFSAVATFREYVQTFPDGNAKGLWAKMPAGQIAKCAEALALRKAFPHDLAGVYTAEEMGQADNATDAAPAPQMQRAQQAEPDEWATAAPRRDYLAEARAAETAEDVRTIYRAAAAEFGPGTATAQEIAAIGATKPGAKTHEQAASNPVGPSPYSMSDAMAEEGAYDDGYRPADETRAAPLDAAEQDPADKAAEAENALRLAASRANLPTLDRDFERVFGLPIAQAAAAQLDLFRERIEAAAGGAQ
ncbi:phage recombination protein Bet [Streptomyces sp. NBC_01237]|uniref:phage recombination protein Bet n=1 Tax=Streptomyces sp. NBC_01237 TaxID=2903790 RepID=UPI002DDC0E9B|nr:phage recombination protein Bet [Streptomyces sp. NBC_01237]WRZ73810.1 phage recombination protein Bet [Streptomyces sp. NBC_01237]